MALPEDEGRNRARYVGNNKWVILPPVERLGENYQDVLLERFGGAVV